MDTEGGGGGVPGVGGREKGEGETGGTEGWGVHETGIYECKWNR